MNARRRLAGDGPANGLRIGGSLPGFNPGSMLVVDSTGRASSEYLTRMAPNGYTLLNGAYGTIPANAAAFGAGTFDFSVAFRVARTDWSHSSTTPILAPTSGNDGIKINILSGRLVQLQIGNGTNFTTYSYSFARALPSVANGSYLEIAVTADRDGLATLYVGAAVWDTVSIAASSAQSISSVEYYLLRDGSTYLSGALTAFGFANLAIPATDVANLWRFGPSSKYAWGSFTAALTPNWTAGADSWAGVRATVAGNVDTISDGATSKDDTLRTYADATASSTHEVRRNSYLTAGKAYRYAGSYLIPSSGGTTYLDGIRVYRAQGSPDSGEVARLTTLGAWTNFAIDDVADSYVAHQSNVVTSITFAAQKGGAKSFTGANSATDDLFYLHGVTVYQLGWTCWLDGSEQAVNHYQWRDRSTNQADATMTNATMLVDSTGRASSEYDYAARSITTTDDIEAGDAFLAVDTTGGAVTINLVDPAGWDQGRIVTIKDVAGTAGTNNITLDPAPGVNLDGSGSNRTISLAYGSIRIAAYNGHWYTV